MPSISKVCFFFEKRDFELRSRATLKLFIESIFKKERQPLKSINYIFVSDNRLLHINRQYLKHDYFTDILTFDLSEGSATESEIYISVDRVRDNAKQLNTSFRKELHRVIFHGALHLCGYTDKSRSERKKMRAKEDYLLSLFGFA